jgi:hypothetical protein
MVPYSSLTLTGRNITALRISFQQELPETLFHLLRQALSPFK